MNLEHFIAKKISFGSKKSFTSIIVKIAIAAISLSLAIMIVTNAIITGFSNQISEKIIAFWGDIHVTDSNINRTLKIRISFLASRLNPGDLSIRQKEE